VTAIELRLLLVGVRRAEPALRAWSAALDAEGVPYDIGTLHRGALMPLLSPRDDGRVPYQGIIFATARAVSALTAAERDALSALQRHAGVRRLIVAGGEHSAWSHAKPEPREPVECRSSFLTPAGRRAFPYLEGRLPLELGRSEYVEPPDDGARTVLLSDDEGRSLLYIRRADGAEDMVQTIPARRTDLHTPLLRAGQLAWLTRGIRLGLSRHYLGIHVDDALHSNFHWDLERHVSDRSIAAAVRMSPADALRAARWARSHRLRLDLTFNGAGSAHFLTRTGQASDPLLETLVENSDCFGWINHTYDHRDLDTAELKSIEEDIARNLSFAETAGLAVDPAALVTGAHSGLANLDAKPPRGHNPAFIEATRRCGIRYLGSDGSRPYPADDGADPAAGARLTRGTPFRLGAAIVIPRGISGLAFDATAGAQVVDRLLTVDSSTVDPEFPVQSWEQLRSSEARRIFLAIVNNRPSPFMFHQSNLIAGVGPGGVAQTPLLIQLLDEVLTMYRGAVAAAVPLVQPTMAELGELLSRTLDWRQAIRDGAVRAYVTDRTVMVENDGDEPVDVPLTGTALGEPYGGTRSGWLAAAPGVTEVPR
jgi:hypothetical protein